MTMMINDIWIDTSNLDRLDNDVLLRLQRNDPTTLGLMIPHTTDCIIEEVGRAIGQNTVLKTLYINYDASSNPNVNWLRQLCHGLSNNYSIECLGIHLANGIQTVKMGSSKAVDGIIQLAPFIFNNSSLRYIDIRCLGHCHKFRSLASALICLQDTTRLERISIDWSLESKIRDIDMAYFFDILEKHTNLECLYLKCPSLNIKGCTALTKWLKCPSSKIRRLDLALCIDISCMAILGSGLNRNTTLRDLNLSYNFKLTSIGCSILSGVLYRPKCSLQRLKFKQATIDDDGIAYLGDALSVNKITSRSLAAMFHVLVKNKNSALKRLGLNENGLKMTLRGWEILHRVLWDKTTIESTFTSNHTFCDEELTDLLDYDAIDGAYEIDTSLRINGNSRNKASAAREKILRAHFATGATSGINALACMHETVLPFALEWIGRDERFLDDEDEEPSLSSMFWVVKSSPHLISKTSNKRKRNTS